MKHLTTRNAMRAIMTAKNATELQDIITRLEKMSGVDRGVFDAASMRLTTLENRVEKFR